MEYFVKEIENNDLFNAGMHNTRPAEAINMARKPQTVSLSARKIHFE